MKRIRELQEFIGNQNTRITNFDEAIVRKLLRKVTVFAYCRQPCSPATCAMLLGHTRT